MSLEQIGRGLLESFFLLSSFFSFLFSDRTARIRESGMSLLIEERRREPLRSLASSGGGRISRDGTHGSEKLKTMIPSRWELYGQPGVDE
jgi:hypothetical protein